MKFMEDLDFDLLHAPNQSHNPVSDFSKIRVKPDHVLLWRPSEDTKMKMVGGVILPDMKEQRLSQSKTPFMYPPNCGRVIGIGDKVPEELLGMYAFYAQRCPVEEEFYRKPQPIILNYDRDNEIPTLWTIGINWVTAWIPHAGDPKFLDLGETGDRIDCISSGRCERVEDIVSGMEFELDGKIWKTTTSAIKGDEVEDGVYQIGVMALPEEG